MFRLLVSAVFMAVALDFSTPDAVLLLANAQVLQSDDEEESVPVRRPRVGEDAQRVAVFPVAPGLATQSGDPPSKERRARAESITWHRPWRAPTRQGLTSSARPASPLDDH